MPKYVAFLRAINVGGHTVKMDVLRGLFAGMRFTEVETFIASGNVIFESPSTSNPKQLAQRIEETLHEALGYEVATFLRTTAEVAEIARYKPFSPSELETEGNMLYIAFLADPPGEEAEQNLYSFTTDVDEFHVNQREVYWLCRKRISESKFSGALLEKTLSMPATVRNSNTVKRIALKYS